MRRSSEACYCTRLYFPFGLLQDLFLYLFPNAITEITRTLTLLFISVHLNANATMKLGFTCMLLLWPEHSFFWCRELARKDLKPKMSLFCFCSFYFVDDFLRYRVWLNDSIKPLQTNFVKHFISVTCKRTNQFLITIDNNQYQSMNQSLYRLLSAIVKNQ